MESHATESNTDVDKETRISIFLRRNPRDIMQIKKQDGENVECPLSKKGGNTHLYMFAFAYVQEMKGTTKPTKQKEIKPMGEGKEHSG